MTWQVVWTSPAAGDMRRLDPETRRRVREAVIRLAETGRGDVKRLRGTDDELRLRVGSWRVRFSFDHSANTIMVLRVLPRGQAYRD